MTEIKKIDTLLEGAHSPNSKMCVMEAVAYVSGEPWSDRPDCVSPVIGAFLRNWNDSLRTDNDRVRLLTPLIPYVLGTKGSQESEVKRSWMAFDWLVREFTPAFMDLTDSLKPHAKALRDLDPIYDKPTLDAALPTLEAVRKASAAAGAAADAGPIARDAAWRMATAAAWGGAWGAAASGAAAGAVSKGAAGEAARDAATAAAAAASGAALASAVLALQESAVDLVKRMADVERVEFKISKPLQIGELVIQ